MTIVLREIPREAADAILAGERPADVRVADDYPTEFSAGVAQAVGTEGQFHFPRLNLPRHRNSLPIRCCDDQLNPPNTRPSTTPRR
jgi:hypothetical protein